MDEKELGTAEYKRMQEQEMARRKSKKDKNEKRQQWGDEVARGPTVRSKPSGMQFPSGASGFAHGQVAGGSPPKKPER